MDYITRELDNKIVQFNFEGRLTDKACFNKIKLDYFLLLTLAACWDIKFKYLNPKQIEEFIKALQRPQTGNLIRLIDSILNLDKSIVHIFDMYKDGRNLLFGHTTFDEYEAQNFNKECELCWQLLLELTTTHDDENEIIRKIYQDDNDLYYITNINHSGDMLIKQFGSKNRFIEFPKLAMKARLHNKDNDIKKGDLFLLVNDQYIKVSPFIQFNPDNELFMLVMDIETDPLVFKMAYVYRTGYANESAKHLDVFPPELLSFFPEDDRKISQNGIALNKFSQFDLFKQDYYQDINKDIQQRLTKFVIGKMPYGAVRGLGGVGKTSSVFIWLNNLLNNTDNILTNIKEKFNLKRIIFLSAKTQIYSRDINKDNLSSFYNLSDDISTYEEFIETVYSILHHKQKSTTQFHDKVNYLKNYDNTTNCILIIIDDYESLPYESRNKIQELKDDLNPQAIKLLITTRFTSKESKDIVVNPLNEQDCAKMADYILGTREWRQDLTTADLHRLTGGLPLLIWYAKAQYKMGQLSIEKLKGHFTGPEKGLDDYLYNNFEQCFETDFSKNFLLLISRYYELHKTLQISRKTIVFLSLADPRSYTSENEEFYLNELADLKLISINKTTDCIDFSPLMIYLEKARNKPNAKEQYQEDALKVLIKLNEKDYKDLQGVIQSVNYLDNNTKRRILERLIKFSAKDSDIRNLAIKNIFEISDNKLSLYEENEAIFLADSGLATTLLQYVSSEKIINTQNYKIVIGFIKALSLELLKDKIQLDRNIDLVDLIYTLLQACMEARETEEITNVELKDDATLLISILNDLRPIIQYTEDNTTNISNILSDISIFCDLPSI